MKIIYECLENLSGRARGDEVESTAKEIDGRDLFLDIAEYELQHMSFLDH
ncbi:hypothetical protein Q6D67_18420 [Haliea sp. E1-2-M8]|nr:hypothetical protein [Haliea sp. E1-2-M8]MDO8863672.1 hypothetical protein [Haliea sp. E1-2-M8]